MFMCTVQEIPEYFKMKVILAFGTVSVDAASPPPCTFRWTVGDRQVGISFWFRTAWAKPYLLVRLLTQFQSLTAAMAAKHLEWILSSTSEEMKCYQEFPYQQQEESYNSLLHKTLAWSASYLLTWNVFFDGLETNARKKSEAGLCHGLLPSWNVTCILLISVTPHIAFLQPAYVPSCHCWGTSRSHCLPTGFGLSSLGPALWLFATVEDLLLLWC